MPRTLLLALGLTTCLLTGLTSHAQSRWERPVGPTIADQGTPLYAFSSFKIASPDGERNYWVQVAIPSRPAPAQGYPVLYMVDGNAAMASLTEADLSLADAHSPPVLVAIGYDTTGRFDVMARAYDYTPPVEIDGAPIAPVVRGRPGGGAEDFTNFIQNEIKPLVEKQAPIDRTRQTLWGHSYGGLFTLYTLSAHADYYQRYVAGDPSLWWHDGALVNPLLSLPEGVLEGKQVRVLVGGGKNAASSRTVVPQKTTQQAITPAPQPQPDRLPDTTIGTSPPPNTMQTVIASIRQAGAEAQFFEIPEKHHGEMLQASLIPALMLAAQP